MKPANQWRKAISASQQEIAEILIQLDQTMEKSLARAISQRIECFNMDLREISKAFSTLNCTHILNTFCNELGNKGYFYRYYPESCILKISLEDIHPEFPVGSHLAFY